MKRILVLIALLALGGCAGSRPFVIKNDCAGSWLVVVDGRGNVLADRLEFGAIQNVDLEGYGGETLYLLASGYDLATNRNLGTAETTRYVPNSNGTPTYQQQVEPWIVNYLYSSDSKGGCHR